METNSKTLLLPGSYSHGTMRPEDLAPRFMAILETVNPERAQELRKAQAEAGDGPDLDYLVEVLFDELQAHCPEGYYFGAHPGDGSDYGVWLEEE